MNIDTGLYEFVRKGDPPVMGITKMTSDFTEETLRKPRMAGPSLEATASKLPATSLI